MPVRRRYVQIREKGMQEKEQGAKGGNMNWLAKNGGSRTLGSS